MLHEFMSQRRDDILQFCLQDLKSEYPEWPENELMHGIPEFVDEVIATLHQDLGPRNAEVAPPEPEVHMAPSHGLFRKRQGFEVTGVVHDFGVVCDAVTALAWRHGESPNPREFQILNRCIDNAIARAVETFTNDSLAHVQSEKAEDLGMFAHEIRNAVSNALIGFELIRQGRAAVKGMTADVVQRALVRIASLVADTISTAQVAHAVAAEPQRIQLAQIISQIVQDTNTERGIRVNIEVDPQLTINADSPLLISALGNLLQNAIKYSRDQQTVTVRANTAGATVSIEVEDRCGGLPTGAEEELFQPFVRKRADGRGTGLGLTIARRAVEAHSGSLHVRNIPGVGCVFEVRLPQAA